MDEKLRKVTHVENIRYDKTAEALYITQPTASAPTTSTARSARRRSSS